MYWNQWFLECSILQSKSKTNGVGQKQSCAGHKAPWIKSTYLEVEDPGITKAHMLTHWGRVTHICVGNRTIIVSDNGLSPGRRQAIIRTSAGLLFIGTLGTNFREILIEIFIFSFKKMRLKVSSAKWQPFCLDLNVLKTGTHMNWHHCVKE